MKQCSISAERSLIKSEFDLSSIFGKFDYDLWSMLKNFNIFISDAC